MQNACARLHLHVRTGKKDVVYYEVKCLPTASALPAPRNGDFGMSRFKGQLLANIHSRSVCAEGQEWLKEPLSLCQEFCDEQCCINVKKLLSIRRRPHMTRSGLREHS